MRTPFGAFIFVAILLLVDLYAFQAFRAVSINSSSRTKTIINIIYWTVTVLAIATFLTLAFSRMDFMPKPVSIFFAIIIGLFLAKLTMVFFVLIDDIRRLFQWIILKIMYSAKNVDTAETEGITRSAFLSWFSLAAPLYLEVYCTVFLINTNTTLIKCSLLLTTCQQDLKD